MGLSFSRQEPHKRTQLPAHEGAIPLGGDIAISAEGDRLIAGQESTSPWFKRQVLHGALVLSQRTPQKDSTPGP